MTAIYQNGILSFPEKLDLFRRREQYEVLRHAGIDQIRIVDCHRISGRAFNGQRKLYMDRVHASSLVDKREPVTVGGSPELFGFMYLQIIMLEIKLPDMGRIVIGKADRSL